MWHSLVCISSSTQDTVHEDYNLPLTFFRYLCIISSLYWILTNKMCFILNNLEIQFESPGHPYCALHGTEIKIVQSYKYLGFWLGSSLTFKQHVEQLA